MLSYAAMEIEQDLVCPHCGRTVTAPAIPSNSAIIDKIEISDHTTTAKAAVKTSEIFKNLTILVALTALSTSLIPLLISFIASVAVAAVILNGHYSKILPEKFCPPFSQLEERLKLFPYELINPCLWFILLLYKIIEVTKVAELNNGPYLVAISIIIAYQLSIKANEVASSSIISFNKLSFKNFLSLWGFFKLDTNANGNDQELDPDATFMEDAAVERDHIEASKNERDQEKVVKHQKLALERTLWEEEVAHRYESWIEEESDRLKSRLDIKQFKEMD